MTEQIPVQLNQLWKHFGEDASERNKEPQHFFEIIHKFCLMMIVRSIHLES